jgi:hypothetical protein
VGRGAQGELRRAGQGRAGQTGQTRVDKAWLLLPEVQWNRTAQYSKAQFSYSTVQ